MFLNCSQRFISRNGEYNPMSNPTSYYQCGYYLQINSIWVKYQGLHLAVLEYRIYLNLSWSLSLLAWLGLFVDNCLSQSYCQIPENTNSSLKTIEKTEISWELILTNLLIYNMKNLSIKLIIKVTKHIYIYIYIYIYSLDEY